MAEHAPLPSECGALVTEGPRRAVYRAVPVPGDLGGGGIGKVLAAGVCGSDLELFRGNAVARKVGPHILGHETVVEVGSASEQITRRWGVNQGDRVFVEEFIPCGWCEQCRGGRYRICPRTDFNSAEFLRYGRTPLSEGSGLWGGFAELLYLEPRARLHPVPPGVPADRAVLATPLANGLRWVRGVADTQVDETVVVLGPGAHGLGCVLAAAEVGAGQTVLVGRPEDRRRLSAGSAFGAVTLEHEEDQETEQRVALLTGDRGADVVIDATGAPAGARLATRLAGIGGRVVLAGGGAAVPEFPADLVTRRELRVSGVRGHDGSDLARAMRLIGSGKYPLEMMSASPAPLSEGAGLLDRLSSGGGEWAHHVLVPDALMDTTKEVAAP